MKNESTHENQAANQQRIYFDTKDESNWQEDADELYDMMDSHFHSDSPEIFIKILAILRNLPSKSWIESAIDDLLRAAFLDTGMTDHVVEQFARACLRSPEPWNLLTGHPQALKDGEGFQFNFSPASPAAEEKPVAANEQTELLVYNLCDYERLNLYFYNESGDKLFSSFIVHESVDDFEGGSIWVEIADSIKSRFEILCLNVRPRREAQSVDRREITLTGDKTVMYVNKDRKALAMIHRLEESHRLIVEVFDSQGKVIRSLTVDE